MHKRNRSIALTTFSRSERDKMCGGVCLLLACFEAVATKDRLYQRARAPLALGARHVNHRQPGNVQLLRFTKRSQH